MTRPTDGPRSWRVRASAGVLLMVIVAALAPASVSVAAGNDDPALTESAQTKAGTGRFADLEVTVGKTETLGNEAVRVSWRWRDGDPASHATTSDTSWNSNYVQVFQCWGDDPDGPNREQCQFGGQYSSQDAGTNRRLLPFSNDPKKAWALSRVVSPLDFRGSTIQESADPLESSPPAGLKGYPAVGAEPGIVPMRAAPTTKFPNGDVVTSIDTGAFFDLYGTNEVPLARTNADGSGQVYFEMQTVYQSQFLGCGERLRERTDGTADARNCWLVVVPRDNVDSSGEDVTSRPKVSDRALFSSPLSLSNWQKRITFPMAFEPVRKACALGGVERPVVGHESMSVAFSSWQGPLCAGGQGYFYATTTDDISRESAASALPKFSVVTEPLPSGTVPASRGSLVYAPVGVSGVSVSVFIERYYASNVPSRFRVYNGTRVEEIRLTPRLVAKLLTQSYRYSTVTIGGGPEHLASAPLSLIDDPEFLDANDFTMGGSADLSRGLWNNLSNQRDSLAKIFVTADSSDAVRLVWEWILGDKDARAFLAGEPDKFGMTINPYFKGIEKYENLTVPRADIPRLDGVCIDAPVGNGGSQTRPVCPLDAAPYVGSFDAGAALTARGQTTGSQSWVSDAQSGFVKPEKPSPQLVGQRALITLTDTPSSQRRGLVAASLTNADGEFVAPSTATMSAALDQAVDTTVLGVLRVNSDKVGASGYPLTRISYGVTNPALLPSAAREDYADLLTFVGTDGQIPGTRPGRLPVGYAPLPRAMRNQALDAAKAIRAATAPVATPASKPSAAISATSRPATRLVPLSATTIAPASAAPTATPTPIATKPAPPEPTESTEDGSPALSGSPVGSGEIASGGGVVPAAPVASASSAAASPGATPAGAPVQIQRVSAVTPATTMGPLRWVLPLLVGLGLASAAAGRLMARRGARGVG